VRHALLVFAALVVGHASARAETAPITDAQRAEAAERFDHAMRLLDEGDDAAAVAELRRVDEIAPHPRVLYDLGLAYAALNRPVDAVATLDRLLAAPGALPADNLTRARGIRSEQARRVATLEITTNVPANIEVDGIDVGRTPLAKPVAIAAGTRLVAALSAGYLPARREITVAGETAQRLELELAPSELRLAHLAIHAAVPDAEILVDGQRVGRTPLPGSIAVAPGRRVVELRRPGYRSERRDVTLDDGATGELGFELAEDPTTTVRGGRLVLAASEPDPDVTVDGQPRGAYRAPLLLPPGVHQLRIARAGFADAERTVTVPENAEAAIKVTLVPTPETRAAYKQRAQLRRTIGWSGILGGAALAVAAGVVVAINRRPLADAQANIDAINASDSCVMLNSACGEMLGPADDNFNKHQTIQNFGLVALGVAVAAAAVGAALVLTGEDPDRYDRAPRTPDTRGLALSSWLEPGRGGIAVGGAF
jgi:PEGA domain-containing protein